MSDASDPKASAGEATNAIPQAAAATPASSPAAAAQDGAEDAAGDHDDDPETLVDLKRREQFGRRAPLPVLWAADDKHPDYAHLAAAEASNVVPPASFKLTPQVLDLLIKANAFDPKGPDDTFVFALRGAELTKGSLFEQVDAVELATVRPDHVNFRCTLGYYHRRLGTLSAFRGSTVPNAAYVRNYYNKVNRVGSWRNINANLLPTGCYRYRVGIHNGRINPALRLSDYDSPSEDGRALVLRSQNDLIFQHDDVWDLGARSPNDNLHCAYHNNEFSSAGCLTIQGPDGQGPWGAFQRVLKKIPGGTPMDVVLLTGKDAAIAATLIATNKAASPDIVKSCLMRLRAGSQGPLVSRLQDKLGMTPTGFLGPVTRQKVVERERVSNLATVRTDSIFSPADDQAFGWKVFDEPGGGTVIAGATTPATAPTESGAATGAAGVPTAVAAIDPDSLIFISAPEGATFAPDKKSVTVPGEGAWTVGPKVGTINFAPAEGFSGRTRPVRYQILDVYGRPSAATVSVDVAAANKGPVLGPDTGRTLSGRPVSVAVLMNDADPDGKIDAATLRFAAGQDGQITDDGRGLTVAGQGMWVLGSDGTVDFRPMQGFVGVARAIYQVADNAGAIATSTVTVTVAPDLPPIQSADDLATTSAGKPVVIDVLKNDLPGPAVAASEPPPAPGPVAPPVVAVPQPDTSPAPAIPTAPSAPSTPTTPAAPAQPASEPPLQGIVPLTREAMLKFAPKAKAKYLDALATKGDRILAEYGINANAMRLAHFMGQIGHESGGLTIDSEDMTYKTPARICEIFGARHSAKVSRAEAETLINNPEKLAERVYGIQNRTMARNLGNTAPGDGYRYRGRGLIQITGRGIYKDFGSRLKIDLEGQPDLAFDGEMALRVAALYWHSRVRPGGPTMNELADANKIEAITKRINGGHNGLPDRMQRFEKAWGIWGSGRVARSPMGSDTLVYGDIGERVLKLERMLADAGYYPGPIDGDFDGRTQRAAILFQNDRGLNIDGRVDRATWAALETAKPRTRGPAAPPSAPRARSLERRPRRAAGPRRRSWLERNNDVVRLVAVLAIVVACAVMAMSQSPTALDALKTANWLPAILLAFGSALMLLGIRIGPERDGAELPFDPTMADSWGSAEDAAPPPEPSADAGAASPSVEQAAEDQTLRKLRFDPGDFIDREPIRVGVSSDGAGDAVEELRPALKPVDVSRVTPLISARGAVTPFPVAAPNAGRVVIAMFGGDNNLSPQVDRDLGEMVMGARKAGNVAVLALADLEHAPASVIEILPAGERRVVERLGEIDTGDPETLATFLARALVSYPSARKAIGFWDHGSGSFEEQDPDEKILKRSVRQPPRQRPARKLFLSAADREKILADRDKRAMLHDNTGGMLTNLEAGHMLEAAFGRAGQSGPVDLLYSDTCLNGMVEVLEELGRFAHCVVASADTEPDDGWDYHGWFTRLAPVGPGSPEDWCRPALDAFEESYRNRRDQHPCTLAAFKTDNLIAERFADLVAAASRNGMQAWSLLTLARGATQQYDTQSARDSYDLIGFAGQLANLARTELPVLVGPAEQLGLAAREARLGHVWLGQLVRDSEGLAFWFPSSKGNLNADIETYRRLRFSKTTGWADYLARMYGVPVS